MKEQATFHDPLGEIEQREVQLSRLSSSADANAKENMRLREELETTKLALWNIKILASPEKDAHTLTVQGLQYHLQCIHNLATRVHPDPA